MKQPVRALLALGLLSLFLPRASAQSSPSQTPFQTVVRIDIDGEIEPILAEYVESGIARAANEHASLILIRMDTPGGLGESMRSIIQAILRSPVPVAIYVEPNGARAASAGFFILESADIAAMSPGTETGAASPLLEVAGHPVQVDPTLRRKIMQDTLAFLRSYVSRRGRNVPLAEKAVTDATAYSAKEALNDKLIDLIADSEAGLLAQLNGRTITRFDGSQTTLRLDHPVIVNDEMSARERFLSRIVQPDAFFILLIVGLLGLYVEFTHPGLVAPGVIGGICLVLALFAMHMLPVNMAGFLLILLAIALFVLEAKFSGHGILGIGGVICLVLGAVMLVRSPMTVGGVGLGVAFGVALPFAVFFILIARLVLRSRLWKPETGTESLIGVLGDVTEPVEISKGMIFVNGELWRAVRAAGDGNAGPIPKGARVRVVKVKGLTLCVEPVETPSASTRAD
ncbi:MAG TPA: nodulation protein NfeD [Patescibacteria group bacterium]|nr:nodulation protein NfeD [Patescibacteria group bacterium]